MDNPSFEQDQGNGGNTTSVWFHGSVAPLVIPIESAEGLMSSSQKPEN